METGESSETFELLEELEILEAFASLESLKSPESLELDRDLKEHVNLLVSGPPMVTIGGPNIHWKILSRYHVRGCHVRATLTDDVRLRSAYDRRVTEMIHDKHSSVIDAASHDKYLFNDALQQIDEAEKELPTEMRRSVFTSSDNNFERCVICYELETDPEDDRVMDTRRRPCCGLRVCGVCLGRHASTLIANGVVKITCPNIDCKRELRIDEIEGFIDAATKGKYDRFLVDANRDPHRKTCPQCLQVEELSTETVKKATKNKKGHQITCSVCRLVWCFTCQAPWHKNMTCKQYRKVDGLFTKWLKQRTSLPNAQLCPKCKVGFYGKAFLYSVAGSLAWQRSRSSSISLSGCDDLSRCAIA